MQTPRLALALLVLSTPACAGNDGGGNTTTVPTSTGPTGTADASTGSTGGGSTSDTSTSGVDTSTSGGADTSTSGESDTGDTEDTETTGPTNCTEVEVQEWIGFGEGDNAIIALTIPQIGELGDNNDLVQIELYDAPPPLDQPIDLSMAPNDNYGTCSQCVRLLEDVLGTDIGKQYFVDSGTITFTGLQGTGEMAGSINDLVFVEVTLDGNLDSTPVDGGDCVVINGQSDFDTIP